MQTHKTPEWARFDHPIQVQLRGIAKQRDTAIDAMKSALAALSQKATFPADVAYARAILADAIRATVE